MSAPFDCRPGVPYPLGATVTPRGVNFAVFSEFATAMELCLFDPEDPQREIARIPLRDVTNNVWHGFVPGLPVGALYGFRAHGPFAPREGLRFNHHKLLVDPYAKAISGQVDWSAAIAPKQSAPDDFDTTDSAPGVPRSVVVSDDFDWSGDTRPSVIWRRTILYELHVKGFTQLHPEVPPELRGTYAGLAHPKVIEHLTSLGITSVQLLPVHESVPEGFLKPRGLTNYWGYNTLGFFAPDQRLSASGSRGQQVVEFKQMVKALHQAGLEVILDVVYNHTCEGNHLGPSLSFRGLDNSTYYWLETDRSRYRDFTGCGNSLDVSHPQVLKLVLDSLRHWVTDFHVDGFRFDLATALARVSDGRFSNDAPFFQALHQDPVLSRVKLIAEPWDLGPDGYRVGQFPLDFSEWNDRYRDTVRRFWRGDQFQAPEVGYRLTGSSDFFKPSGRRPMASINFVTCHDGFTLRDLVSYSRKHNEPNGEENRDGTDDNNSWNSGVEGETDDPVVQALRDRQSRNLLATLLLSVGTPMLTAGDELGRTQQGNNNAYCQDNERSWLDWNLDTRKSRLLDFTRTLVQLRNHQPVLQRRNFFQGATLEDSRFEDLVWLRPDGKEMAPDDWKSPHTRCLGYFLGGDAIGTRDPQGQKLVGDSLLVFLNAQPDAVELTLPGPEWGERWELVLDTSRDQLIEQFVPAAGNVMLLGRSLVLWRLSPLPNAAQP